MESQAINSTNTSIVNRKNTDKDKKIGRYLGKFNMFKANLETKIRSRLNFLKEKVLKNVKELRRLSQVLFTQKISSLPSPDKKQYFQILKTKKKREVDSKDEEDYLRLNKGSLNESHSVDYEQFLNFKHNSSDSSDSNESEGTISENDMLCDKLKLASIDPQSFRNAFTTNFVSIAHFKEDDSGNFYIYN